MAVFYIHLGETERDRDGREWRVDCEDRGEGQSLAVSSGGYENSIEAFESTVVGHIQRAFRKFVENGVGVSFSSESLKSMRSPHTHVLGV